MNEAEENYYDWDPDNPPLLVAIVEDEWEAVTQKLKDDETSPEEVANGIVMVSDNIELFWESAAPAGKDHLLGYELRADNIEYITKMKKEFGLSSAYDNNYLLRAAYRYGFKDLYDLLSRDSDVMTSLQQEDSATYEKLVASIENNDAQLRDEILNGPWAKFDLNWVQDGADELFA